MPILWMTALVFVTPLLVWTGLPYPTTFPQWVWFAVTGTLTLALWLWHARSHELRINRIDSAALALLGTLTLSAFAGADPRYSWFGSMERSMGLGFWIIGTGVFFAAKKVWGAETREILMWRVLMGISALMSLWALAQKLIPGFAETFSGARVGGTVGNAVFLGMYLSLMLIVHAYVWTRRRAAIPAVYIALSATLCALALTLTQTRSALAALAVGALVSAYGFKKELRESRRYRVGVIISCILIAGAGVFVGVRRGAFHAATLQSRTVDWNIAWHGFLQRPLLGWGPENYRYAADSAFDSRLTRFGLQETYADKPHSVQLELLTTGGILSALAYLACAYVLIRALISLYKEKKLSAPEVWILIGLFVAREVQNTTGFETHATAVVLIAVASFVSSQYDAVASWKLTRRGSYVIGGTLFVASLYSLIVGALQPLSSARAMHTPENHQSLEALGTDIHAPYVYDEWQTLMSAVVEPYWNQRTALLKLSAQDAQIWQTDFTRVQDLTHRLAAAHTTSGWWQLMTAKAAFQQYSITEEAADAEFTKQALLRATTLSPGRQEPLIILAQLAEKQNHLDEAQTYLERAIALDPHAGIPRMYRVLLAFAQHDPQTAWREIKIALDDGYTFEGVRSIILPQLKAAHMDSEAAEFESRAR